MRSLDKDGRQLEEIIDELLSDKDLNKIKDPVIRTRIKIQRLKGEMRKYLNRPRIFASQIAYIRKQIEELENQYPEAETIFYKQASQ